MKTLIQLAMTIFGALTIPVLQAQTIEMQVTIPFEFNIGKTLMPAGRYVVESRGSAVLVRAADGATHGVFAITTLDSKTPRGESRLEFHQYGSEYFLAAIRDPSVGIGRAVPQTHREKQIARSLKGSVEATVIAANRPNGPGKP